MPFIVRTNHITGKASFLTMLRYHELQHQRHSLLWMFGHSVDQRALLLSSRVGIDFCSAFASLGTSSS